MADWVDFLFSTAFLAQQDRLIKLTTPLGDDVLLPQRVIGEDRLGRGYDYTVDCVAVRNDIELKRLVGQPVTLWIQQADRGYLPVHGFVHRIKRLGSDGQFLYPVLIRPVVAFSQIQAGRPHLAG